MEKLIKDLNKLVSFKDTLVAGDIVLIAAKKPQMLVYALIDAIILDETKRDEWWHVSMHVLSLPPRMVTWTLRTSQMTGLETFTMDGEERFMKAVRFADKEKPPVEMAPLKESPKRSSLRRIK